MNAQQLTTAEPTAPETIAVNGTEILEWLEHAFTVLRNSPWGPFFQHGEIDVLDASISSLYLNSLAFMRHDRTRTTGKKQGTISRTRQEIKRFGSRTKRSLENRALARQSAPLQQADILFWPCEPTHVKAMLPVLRWMDEKGIRYEVFACRSNTFNELHAQGIQAIFPYAYWGSRLRAALRTGSSQCRKLSKSELFDLSPLRPMDDTPELVKSIRFYAARLLPLIYEAKVNCEQIFHHIKPRTIVVGNDVTFQGRIACRMARTKGVPTACPMHGLLALLPIHTLHIADRYIAYGEASKQILTTLGFPDERVAVCGAPYLDHQPKQMGVINETVRRNLQLDPSKPYVLAATSGPGNSVSHEHHAHIIETLCHASRTLPEMQIVAKLHRKDHVKYYNQVLSRVPGANLHVVPYGVEGYPGDIFEWLQGCDVLLTGASSVAIEAMLLDVPVVTMDFADEIGATDFISQGATTHVTTPEELMVTLRTISDTPAGAAAARDKSQAFLQNIFLSHDGRSAERVGTELCRMAGLSHE